MWYEGSTVNNKDAPIKKFQRFQGSVPGTWDEDQPDSLPYNNSLDVMNSQGTKDTKTQQKH